MYFAVTFQQDTEGFATGYSVHAYSNFLLDMRNRGYKPHLSGMRSNLEAELEGNRLTGTAVVETVPPAQAAIKARHRKTPTTKLTSLSTDKPTADMLALEDQEVYGEELATTAEMA